MSKNAKEYLTGIILGLLIGALFFAKLAFGAELTEEDKELICKTVQAEAGNQDLQGKRLVAAVIINRVDSPVFPNTTEDVLSQKNQFSTYNLLNSTTPTWQDRLAVEMETETRSNTEVFFFRTGRYGTGTPMFVHGDHYFSGLDDKK